VGLHLGNAQGPCAWSMHFKHRETSFAKTTTCLSINHSKSKEIGILKSFHQGCLFSLGPHLVCHGYSSLGIPALKQNGSRSQNGNPLLGPNIGPLVIKHFVDDSFITILDDSIENTMHCLHNSCDVVGSKI
jgi:hypothetical protein